MSIRREAASSDAAIGEAGTAGVGIPDAGTAGVGIPDATVARLANYLRALTGFAEQGISTVSSEALAAAAGANSAALRKDLSYLGSYGIRGVGYDVDTLTHLISRTLGLAAHRSVVLIGVGNLGQALAGYAGFSSRGFEIAALIDVDPQRVGTHIDGLRVHDVGDLEFILAARTIDIAVLATPAEATQEICDRLVAAGVTSILNFAPIALTAPSRVEVRQVDLAAELQILSFHEYQKENGQNVGQDKAGMFTADERHWARA